MRRSLHWTLLLFALSFALAALAQPPTPTRVIGFLTDFGLSDDSVGLCKAVIETVAPGARVIDLTHQIEPFNVALAARTLAGATPYFPRDAIFVAVVDPGVGSTRKAIAVQTKTGQTFVLPDNGLITLVAVRDGLVEAHEITNPAWMLGTGLSSTFHGRDIFSPAAAHLARGEALALAGPALDPDKLVRLAITNATIDAQGLHGQVIATDGPFGNLILDVPQELFAQLGYRLGDRVHLTLDGRAFLLPFVKTFSDVPVGEDLLYIDSRGRLAIGANQRNFAESRKLGAGTPLWIPGKTVN